MHKEKILNCINIAAQGFALEMKINKHIFNNKIPFKSIMIQNIKNTPNSKKMPFMKTQLEDFKMIKEIFIKFGTFKTFALMTTILIYYLKFKRNF